MGKLYDNFIKMRLENNMKNNAQLIYTLAAIETNCKFMYSLEREAEYNQVWLYSRDKSVEGASVLLQASQRGDGSVLLSIQGLGNKFSSIKNFIDYNDSEEHDMFMEYLKLF